MKKIYILWILVGILAMFASCAATPPAATSPTEETGPQTGTPQAAQPSQASLNALNAAVARAEAARKLVLDFNAPELLPSEWQSAESLYNEAVRQRNTSTAKDVEDSTARFNRAAAAFEDMKAEVVAQYYESKMRELLDARNQAIEAGARELIPDFFYEADDVADEAFMKYEANDHYAAKENAEKAILMYKAMKAGLDADRIRQELLDRGVAGMDPDNFDLANTSLENAISDYTNKNYSGAKENAESALSRFSELYRAISEAYGSARGADAEAARQKALDARAHIAVKQDFDDAEVIFIMGNSAFLSKRFDEAAGHYARCTPMFLKAAEEALRKRQIAEDALRRADQRLAESEETARNAELILEGGEE